MEDKNTAKKNISQDSKVKHNNSQDSDELGIDFTPIKKFFSKKEEHHLQKNKSTKEKNDEEDLEIDFSGVKNLFSKKEQHHESKSHESKNKEENEDMNIDFSNIKNFFSNHKKSALFVTLALIMIPLLLTMYIRLLPADLPATDSWARNSVENYYQNSISQQIREQYPNLPAQQLNQLVAQQWNQFKSTNKAQIDEQVRQTSEYFKTGFRYEENGKQWTFLGDLDSYFWLRQARNLNEKGSICDEFREGVCYDNHMLAPTGNAMGIELHPYAIFTLYKILHAFDKNITLMRASFLLPMIIALIATVAAFFIGKKLMNEIAGFFAAMLLALSPLFITRTLGSDTDIWNITFSLLIMWMFLEAFESKKVWKSVTFASIAGFFGGVFSFAWGQGWWYVFDFIVITLIAYILFELMKNYLEHKNIKKIFNKDTTHAIIITITIILSTGIFVTLFSSFDTFKGTITTPISLIGGLKVATQSTLWPNVYTTVAELNEASVSSIIGQLSFGMPILFALALLGIIMTMIKKTPDIKEYMLILASTIIFSYLISSNGVNLGTYVYIFILAMPIGAALIIHLKEKESTVDIKPALMLTVWFVGMIFASTKGVRFILLLIPAFSIALGVMLGYLYQYFSRLVNDTLKISENLSKLLVFLILIMILIQPLRIGVESGKSFVPSITKGWYDSLIKIRDESKPDAIINSWWDFGHWFKYFADRAVTADGASQNTPRSHWLGLALQTNDQKRSLGILRMLDCGGNNAFDEVNKKWNDTEISENIVSELVVLDKSQATKKLKSHGYTDEEIATILNYTHCDPPENYFITSEDMVGKAGVWAHFGLWNFDRAYIINNLKDKPLNDAVDVMQSRWNYSKEEATKIYYEVQSLQTDREVNDWIAPWPNYATGVIPCVNVSDMIICDIKMGVGGNAQQNIVLERSVINISNPRQNGQILMSVYDRNTNAKLGDQIGNWNQVVIADETIDKYDMNNASLSLSILINVNIVDNKTTYSAIVADPLLIDSTFTKLFFLEGKYMDKFERFSDVTDITGTRIIVWKVKWD